MGKSHLKRIAAPKSWPIKRKSSKWVYRPNPGPHKIENSLPIGVIVKELLGYVKNTKEIKYVLNQKKVLVNGKIRKDHKFPVGVMDVLTVGNDNFRVLLNKKGKLTTVEISSAEAKVQPKKIIGKKSLKGKKLQVNLTDGTNILSKEDYKVGDTLVFSENKVKDHFKLEKGAIIYIISGKQVGSIGILKKTEEKKGLQQKEITFTQGKEDYKTLKKYAFVIGKNKPVINIPNE